MTERIIDTHGNDNADDLVADHLRIVERLVEECTASTEVPAYVDRDLWAAGRLALIRAADAWEPVWGVPFARFATHMIRAAVDDELQAIVWMQRSECRGSDAGEPRLADAIAGLPDRLRMVMTACCLERRQVAEVAAELGMSQRQVAQLRAQALVLLRSAFVRILDTPVVDERPQGWASPAVPRSRRDPRSGR